VHIVFELEPLKTVLPVEKPTKENNVGSKSAYGYQGLDKTEN